MKSFFTIRYELFPLLSWAVGDIQHWNYRLIFLPLHLPPPMFAYLVAIYLANWIFIFFHHHDSLVCQYPLYTSDFLSVRFGHFSSWEFGKICKKNHF
jgi:hypothetical protein